MYGLPHFTHLMWSVGLPHVFGVMAVLLLGVGVLIQLRIRHLMPDTQPAHGQVPWMTVFTDVRNQTLISHQQGEADCLILST